MECEEQPKLEERRNCWRPLLFASGGGDLTRRESPLLLIYRRKPSVRNRPVAANCCVIRNSSRAEKSKDLNDLDQDATHVRTLSPEKDGLKGGPRKRVIYLNI
jgi:hypothetical protein